MNQILVSEKLYITPELRRKKRMYKIDFFISVFLVCILFSYYIYAEYDKNKNEAISKEILSNLSFEDNSVDDTTIKFANNSIVMEDGSGVIILESADDTNPITTLSHDISDVMQDGEHNNISALDIPRIYFVINDKFISSTGEAITPNVINSFITTLLSLSDNCVEHNLPDTTSYITEFILKGDTYDGITLVPGVDYFINKTFADYLINVDLGVEYPDLVMSDTELYEQIHSIYSITLPNYLDSESNIQTPWIPLTTTEENKQEEVN